MVTSVTNVQVTKAGHDFVYRNYSGLSTDTKPTTGVYNGSTFLEMDTGKKFAFDAQHEAWLPISGGAGESYTKEEIDEMLSNLKIEDLKQEEPIEIYGGDSDEQSI